MEKEGTVRSTFANLRNLNRHQNKKHIQDAKVRKCPFEGCEVFSSEWSILLHTCTYRMGKL